MEQVLCQLDKLRMEINDIQKREPHNDQPNRRDKLNSRRRCGVGATYQENTSASQFWSIASLIVFDHNAFCSIAFKD